MEHFFENPPNYYALSKAVYKLEAYKRARVFSLGRSSLGREIYGIAIGKVQNASLLVGGVHGAEWITTMLLMRFCKDLLCALEQRAALADIDVTHCLHGRGIVFVPCLNPDGVEIALDGAQAAGVLRTMVEPLILRAQGAPWQANARGVDLNHNFPAGWELLHKMEESEGITCPSHSRYGGTHPASEAETQAIMRFCTAASIRTLYAVHAQGEEIYYHYGEHTPPRSQLMAQILASSCGYRVVSQPKGTAAHGGLKDWFIQSLHRPGFTLEIGRGQNPLPICELEPIYARLIETLVLTAIL